MTDASTPQVRRNRTALLVIAAIFFGGMLVAGALRLSGWRPAVNRNHGELLQPPADLRAVAPRLADGNVYAWNPKARTWRIAVAPPADCTRECDKLAHDIDLVTRLMGKDADKVDVLWLCAREGCTPPAPLRHDPNLRVLSPDAMLHESLQVVDRRAVMPSPASGSAAGQAMPAPDASDPAPVVPIYVIDPNGFLILRYPPGSDPGGLRADLAKLLKLM